MSRTSLFVFLACASLGTLSGCKEKAAPVEPPALPAAAPVAPAVPAPATAAAPVAAAPVAPAVPAVPGLPTSEDYEQQAIDQINPQSMEAELDQLEKDIGK